MKTGLESLFQCAAESTNAGAINERVDILMAPSRDTSKSNQGTVAAIPTSKVENYSKYGF